MQQLAGAIHSTVNRNTGFTPNLMMLGCENILQQVHQLARDNLLSSQLRQKKDYDLRLKVKTYEVGDLVYKLDSAKKVGQSPNKLQQVWKGPFLVTKVLSPVSFRVCDRKKS